MHSKMKNNFILVFLLCNFCWSQNFDEGTGLSKLNVGDTIPEFKFTNLEGHLINSTEYSGKYIYINFFATWCEPCIREMKLIEKDIWEIHKSNSNFIILSFGREDTDDDIKKFINQRKFTFPIFPDKDRTIYNLFAVSFIPRNYIINPEGIIIYSEGGFYKEEFEKMKEKLNLLLTK